MGWKLTVGISVLILLATAAILFLINTTEPTAQNVAASRRTPMLVETTKAEFGTFAPQINVMGNVQAKESVGLQARVTGEVVEISSLFEAGQHVKKGDHLLKIDPADFENDVARAQSALEQAQANLELELGYQKVAEMDLELVGDNIDWSDRSLALRQPQLKLAQAEVATAEADLKQAELLLQRTNVVAPFDAQILSREVSIGSQVDSGTELAQLAGTQAYWVVASIPLDKLQNISFRTDDGSVGSKATLRNKTAWPSKVSRIGFVDQFIGSLDSTTRLARVQILVEDPLALSAAQKGTPPLIIGSLLEVSIEGKPIENVYRIDRAHLRQDNTVWVKQEGVLRIVPVDIAFLDSSSAYISAGLGEEDEIVATSLSSVVEGAALRTEDEPLTVE